MSAVIENIAANAAGGVISAAIIGSVMFFIRTYARSKDKNISKKELVLDIKNKTYRPTVLVFLYSLGLLQLAWNIIILGSVPILKQLDYYNILTAGSEWVYTAIVLLLMGCAMIPIAMYLNHRLAKPHFAISLLLIATSYILTVVEISMLANSFPTVEDAGVLAILLGLMLVIFLPGFYVGKQLAKKSQLHFTMYQLLKRLPERDKRELIELVDSLPSITDKRPT